MFEKSDYLRDNLDDEIGQLIQVLISFPSWTQKKQKARLDLIAAAKDAGYIYFRGEPKHYHLTRVGDSVVVDVPNDRKGHLSVFGGQRVRMVCVRSGTRFNRYLMAGPI